MARCFCLCRFHLGKSIPPGISYIHSFIHTYILVQMYLPVAFLSDWDPVDRTFVEGMVYSPQDQLTTILSVIFSESRRQVNSDVGVGQHALMIYFKSKIQTTALSKFRFGWMKRIISKL